MTSPSGVRRSDAPPLDTEPNPRSRGHVDTISNTPLSIPHSRLSPASSISSAGFGPLSPYATDRIFPIRSVVNIEPQQNTATSISGTTRSSVCSTSSNEEQYFREGSRNHSLSGNSRCGSTMDQDMESPVMSEYPPVSQSPSATTSQRSDIGTSVYPESEKTGFYTAKHKHAESKDGHMIVTGVSGSETIQKCEDEPIHIPGAVQGFGCLVAFNELDDGILDVRVVSENSHDIIGYSPHELFDRGNFCSVLSDEQAENMFDHIDFLREDTDPKIDGPEVFSIIITGPDAIQIKLWCAIHAPDMENKPDFFICEFEMEDDHKYPLTDMSDGARSPEVPEDTLGSAPTAAELMDSTMSTSRPLRVLRHARRRRGEAAAIEVFNLMSQIQEQLASATNLEDFLKVVVGLVKELTGFHRVMIYQFDEAWNGCVVTELVDPRATKDLFKGLNFPASDIPAQARDLYKLNKVRLLYDRDQSTARLVCKEEEDLVTPLDLTHSYLRAMSPIHLKYLANMAVRSSMSISITAFDQLWGLVSCHGYGQKGMRVSFPIRKMCRLIGETTSRNIERLSYARRLHARKLINTVPTEQNPGGYIVASSNDLLKLFDADCGLVSIRDETKVLGKVENTQESLVMLEYLRMKNITTVLTSQDLTKDFPDLKYSPGFKVLAGLLLVPLTSSGSDFIVFFRHPQLKNVHWAGNPYEKTMKAGTDAYLEPRKSFKIWSETVVGKSREWTEEQIETAAVLCLVYGKFIEVWRQKEAALKNSQLTRLLLANASHEVRTPLNAIINYLEIALEGPLDRDTRDNLSKSHSASKSLIYVINDLLDLTRTEGGKDLIQDETFDIRQTIFDATAMFQADSERKNLVFEIVEYPGLPSLVKGDRTRIRQVVSNITANAVKHTTQGGIQVEIWTEQVEDGKCEISIAVQDTGVGMSAQKLDTLFREFEQVHSDEAELESNTVTSLAKVQQEQILGLGLAVVARSVRNMNGQLRLKSEEGKGSRFTITVPLNLPEGEVIEAVRQPSPGPVRTAQSPSPPLQPDGAEVLLVQTSPPRPVSVRPFSEVSRRDSGGNDSIKSNNSAVSEIDRLVDAISSPGLPSATGSKSAAPPKGPPMRRTSSLGAVSESKPVFENIGQDIPGQKKIDTSIAPVKPMKISAESVSVPAEKAGLPSASTFPRKLGIAANSDSKKKSLPPPENPEKFVILVAEDDPINSKIVQKRLEKMGHDVELTVNGKECFEVFGNTGSKYDAVLMDMQMPIMDGGESARQIRQLEAQFKPEIPFKHLKNGRVPIFAVSASLIENNKPEYCEMGFDGWVLKPIDFKRLAILLEGIRNEETRKEEEYVSGKWERGGWFSGTVIKNDGVDDVSPAMVKTQQMER
ncbi:hypothetical protein EDC01DRAFT_374673 [Geopyxis carbonaria]|nr:hypothetical protein EDC01DRAFT_374673 [Geopyxis carbonaria]